ncbi:MAG: hypothetical protein ABIK79_03065 [Chloroflexota bacterium]
MLPGADARSGRAVLLLVLLLLSLSNGIALVFSSSPVAAQGSDRFATVSFPIGTHVIPMDDKQADRLKAFGLAHLIARQGGILHRVIEPPDIVLFTEAHPAGDVYRGGPIFILAEDGSILQSAWAQFPSVTVEQLTQGITLDRVYQVRRGTNILLIQGLFGRTELVLDDMGIPYTVAQRSEVAASPEIMNHFDLIIDDCPGWRGDVPSHVAYAMRERVAVGGEIIFTDIAIDDLNEVFPGYCAPVDNHDGTWEFTFHNVGEFLTQYSGPPSLPILTKGGGVMVSAVSEDVIVMLDTELYGSPGDYAVAGFYFRYWDGIVEGLAIHPPEQSPESRVLTSIIFGNKFVHSISVIPTPEPTPTPGERCVSWAEYTHEEFEPPSLPGWTLDDGGGRVEVVDSVLHLRAGSEGGERFPLLARADLFPPHGDFILEVSFRYSRVQPYGTTIGVGSSAYLGDRYQEGDPPPPGIEDVLSIHQFADAFCISMLGDGVTWVRPAGDEDWHTVRLEAQCGSENTVTYILSVDGERIGIAASSLYPVSIFLGNPSIQLYSGLWTEMHVDYIRVWSCDAWGRERFRLPLIIK